MSYNTNYLKVNGKYNLGKINGPTGDSVGSLNGEEITKALKPYNWGNNYRITYDITFINNIPEINNDYLEVPTTIPGLPTTYTDAVGLDFNNVKLTGFKIVKADNIPVGTIGNVTKKITVELTFPLSISEGYVNGLKYGYIDGKTFHPILASTVIGLTEYGGSVSYDGTKYTRKEGTIGAPYQVINSPSPDAPSIGFTYTFWKIDNFKSKTIKIPVCGIGGGTANQVAFSKTEPTEAQIKYKVSKNQDCNFYAKSFERGGSYLEVNRNSNSTYVYAHISQDMLYTNESGQHSLDNQFEEYLNTPVIVE